MAETGSGRRAQRAAARAERQERERTEAARARRRTRLFQLGGIVALAAAVVVVVVLATGGGGDGGRPAKRAGETVAGAQDTAALFDGIPQDGATLGRSDAPVTLVEFGDLQCPYCKQASDTVLPAIVDDYVRPGSVKLVFSNVAFLGTDSVRAAQVAGAAARQGKLWEFVHLFYVNQGPEKSGYVTDDFLREIAGGVAGLDVERAMAERGDPAILRAIDAAGEEWRGRYGLISTPAYVVGRSGGTLAPVDGLDLASLQQAIDRELAAAR